MCYNRNTIDKAHQHRIFREESLLLASGSDFMAPEMFTAHLTSRQLKVKLKDNSITGLQLADLIAHPSFRATLARREHFVLYEPIIFFLSGHLYKISQQSQELVVGKQARGAKTWRVERATRACLIAPPLGPPSARSRRGRAKAIGDK